MITNIKVIIMIFINEIDRYNNRKGISWDENDSNFFKDENFSNDKYDRSRIYLTAPFDFRLSSLNHPSKSNYGIIK